jgi:hypothetical protein
VSTELPAYLFCGDAQGNTTDCDDAEQDFPYVADNSSDKEWFPDFNGCVESSYDDFNVDIVGSPTKSDNGFSHWCMQPEVFKAGPLDVDQLAMYYRRSSWTLDSVDFVGTRDTFTGPATSFKLSDHTRVPRAQHFSFGKKHRKW